MEDVIEYMVKNRYFEKMNDKVRERLISNDYYYLKNFFDKILKYKIIKNLNYNEICVKLFEDEECDVFRTIEVAPYNQIKLILDPVLDCLKTSKK